jgi:quercetin dioxygenase-like cupin family protein
MKRLAVLGAIAALALSVTTVGATPGTGATSAILAQGVFDPISTSQTGGLESVIQDVTIAPGGHTGWHSHPGGTVIIVESGTFSFYNDTCALTTVPAGRGVVEPGLGVQLARNEGAVPLVLTVIYFDIASPDGPVRADAATPACAAGAGLPTTAAGTGVTGTIVDRATFASAAAITGGDERDVVVQSATFAPGGHSGWHSHPGATVIYVVSGTFSFYPATTCQRQDFAAGQGVVEQGGGIQLARNESTTEPLVLFVVYFDVPTATPGAFRIDQAEPAGCQGLAPVPTATPAPVPTATPAPVPTATPRPTAPPTDVGTIDGTIRGAPVAPILLVLASILVAAISGLAARRIRGIH